jgi:hypothetical protein
VSDFTIAKQFNQEHPDESFCTSDAACEAARKMSKTADWDVVVRDTRGGKRGDNWKAIGVVKWVGRKGVLVRVKPCKTCDGDRKVKTASGWGVVDKECDRCGGKGYADDV